MDFNLIFATSLCCQIMTLQQVLLKIDVHFSRLVSVASRSSDPANEWHRGPSTPHPAFSMIVCKPAIHSILVEDLSDKTLWKSWCKLVDLCRSLGTYKLHPVIHLENQEKLQNHDFPPSWFAHSRGSNATPGKDKSTSLAWHRRNHAICCWLLSTFCIFFASIFMRLQLQWCPIGCSMLQRPWSQWRHLPWQCHSAEGLRLNVWWTQWHRRIQRMQGYNYIHRIYPYTQMINIDPIHPGIYP